MRRASFVLMVVFCLALIAGSMTPMTAAAAPAAHTASFYVVRAGDTLSGIALRFGFTTAQLAAANRVSNPNRIFVGQVLILPAHGTVPTRGTYIVQRGDTLSGIALRFRTTVRAIMVANALRSTTIFVGQRLVIPPGVPPTRVTTYCVRPGDTLWGIARRFGTTIQSIIALNGLRSTTIFVGQCLRVDP
ncbi:MAG: LysM peptidoglycan-binding domain-containing protein [Ardenticatenaceae bacterium]|nr:LysM peptidoglycan-binding domain-containing protein [Ardenticatenaceae bacterium]HBY97929.1 hypothetical protein [Chloroflexota bacterium]